MPELPCWYYDKKDLKNTPSFQNGIEPETEARYRREGARFIISTGTKMGLRYDTMATGVVYFHRFYMFHSFKDFPRYVTACCCLFLAGKVEETPKKCKNIIKTARSLLTDKQYLQFGEDPREEVMTLEKILLQTIKFDLQVEHPYSYLLKYAKRLKGDKQKIHKMVQMAWTFVNDSLCTTLSLQWESEIIAIALMYLAGKLSKFEVVDWHGRTPKHARWWDMFVEDISMDLLEDICHQVLDLYSNTPTGSGAAGKPESPPATPPSQVPITRPPLPAPPAPQQVKPRNTPPAQPLTAIPVQLGKLKPEQHLKPEIKPVGGTPASKKMRLNSQTVVTPIESMPPQPPLPTASIPPPQPPPYSFPPTASDNYAQYATPPPGFQGPPSYQGYPPPEPMQQPFDGDPRYNQGHYQGNYDNSGYQNYQQPSGQPYYNVPPPPTPFPPGQGYQDAYPTEYPPGGGAPPPPNAPYPPQAPGYPPPPNPNYPVSGPYPPRGGPPMGQHASPNPNVAPVRITGRANRQNWAM